jgi:hypothetical protein
MTWPCTAVAGTSSSWAGGEPVDGVEVRADPVHAREAGGLGEQPGHQVDRVGDHEHGPPVAVQRRGQSANDGRVGHCAAHQGVLGVQGEPVHADPAHVAGDARDMLAEAHVGARPQFGGSGSDLADGEGEHLVGVRDGGNGVGRCAHGCGAHVRLQRQWMGNPARGTGLRSAHGDWGESPAGRSRSGPRLPGTPLRPSPRGRASSVSGGWSPSWSACLPGPSGTRRQMLRPTLPMPRIRPVTRARRSR